jgi:hypothetical protein
MINALQVLTHMTNWSIGPEGRAVKEKNSGDFSIYVLFEGVRYIQKETVEDYKKLKTTSSMIAHFRQSFTTWKAVCSRLVKNPTDFEFFNPQYDAVLAFPYYLEMVDEQLYAILYRSNVFLGITLPEAAIKRIVSTEEQMRAKEQRELDRRVGKAQFEIFKDMFFTNLVKSPRG